MTFEQYALIWLYVFGAAGFGTAVLRAGPDLSVMDFLIVVAWPVTMPLWMVLNLIFGEIFNRQ